MILSINCLHRKGCGLFTTLWQFFYLLYKHTYSNTVSESTKGDNLLKLPMCHTFQSKPSEFKYRDITVLQGENTFKQQVEMEIDQVKPATPIMMTYEDNLFQSLSNRIFQTVTCDISVAPEHIETLHFITYCLCLLPASLICI